MSIQLTAPYVTIKVSNRKGCARFGDWRDSCSPRRCSPASSQTMQRLCWLQVNRGGTISIKRDRGDLNQKNKKNKKHQLFGASGSVFAHIVSAVNPQRLWRHLPFIGFPFTLSPPSLSACPLPPSPVTRRLAVTRRSLIFVADALRCAAQWRLYSRSWNGPVFSPPSKSHFSPRKSSTESSEVPGKR